ncbi:MAG: hypothetical protein O3A14_08960 [Cyanobacteria bacterium]|nr:hypothetical protein [Cyanobacteriota bacterium]
MSYTNTANDIRGQARQGSVAAINQVLNEALAQDEVRTRAVLVDGVLQLLCEGPTPEQLPQAVLVPQVKALLEDMAPRGIRRVNLTSRIVREQQLLWLDEVTQNVDNQVLWTESVALKQPNPLGRWLEDRNQPKVEPPEPETQITRRSDTRQYFWRGIIGGASLCVLLLGGFWVVKHRLGISLSVAGPDEPASTATAPAPPQQDSFVQAVRLAEQAATDGQAATTAAAWLDLAARWQRASDLMGEVEADDPRYPTAQDRVETYRQNSEQALVRSEQIRTDAAEDAATDEESEVEPE